MRILRRTRLYLLFPLLISSPVFARQKETTFEVSVSKYLMGTVVETTARHADVNACKQALNMAYEEMARVEKLLSARMDSSETAKINRFAGVRPVKVSHETFALLQRAKSYSERFDYLFDVTIGPLSRLWGFNEDGEIHKPSLESIQALLSLVGSRNLILDARDTTAYLMSRGMRIDLGGIAKGYAVDRGAAVLHSHGIRDFILNAGGDLYVSGRKSPETMWLVGIKHPRRENALIAEFELEDSAVATSGDYERFKIIDGTRYHHILDPRTGYPGTLSQSATTIASTAEEADVLATCLFLLGSQQVSGNGKLACPFLVVAADGTIHYNDLFAGTDHFTLEED